jgi:hypothetical protein
MYKILVTPVAALRTSAYSASILASARSPDDRFLSYRSVESFLSGYDRGEQVLADSRYPYEQALRLPCKVSIRCSPANPHLIASVMRYNAACPGYTRRYRAD